MKLLSIAYWDGQFWRAAAPAVKAYIRGIGRSDGEAFLRLAAEIEKQFSEKDIPLRELQTGWIDRGQDKVFYYAMRRDKDKWWAMAPALIHTVCCSGEGNTAEEAMQDLERKVRADNSPQGKISIREIDVYRKESGG